MINFFKKLFNIQEKINYINYPCNGLHRCPKCNGDMLITALEGKYDSYIRPNNVSWCTECGYEIDHVLGWEIAKGYKPYNFSERRRYFR